MKPWIPRLIVIASLSTLSACGGGRGAGTNTLTPNSPPPTPNQWTWVSGSNLANQPGIYGSLGTPASSDVPGTRWAALGWTDARGNLWFFGGNGYGSTRTDDILNDLWEYSAGEWTWIEFAQRTRRLWNPRRGFREQRSRRPFSRRQLDRLVWKLLAPRWLGGGRHVWTRPLAQRPMEVQRWPVDLDGRIEFAKSARRVRNSGSGFLRQCSRRAVR
jgi:hypothetical protein